MRRFCKAFFLLLLLLLIALGAGSYLMVDLALSPPNRGKDLNGSYAEMFGRYPFLQPYMDSLMHVGAWRDTSIVSPDGVRLHGYYVRANAPTTQTAVIVHGYTDNAIRMMMIGYMYHHDLGFNILLPDLRYSGLSEGDHLQMGWNDRKDVALWLDVAGTLFGDTAQMVVHGISMGAATVMMLSGDVLPDNVKCLVEDCGYTSVWDEFEGELKKQYGLPAFPLLYTSNWMCRLLHGWSFTEASALKQVARCALPMLFIHGENDEFVPTAMVYPLYEAKPMPKELWIVPSEGHAFSYRDCPEEYTRKVSAFVHKYM